VGNVGAKIAELAREICSSGSVRWFPPPSRRGRSFAAGVGPRACYRQRMPRKPRLGPERCSALGILADAPRGLTEDLLLARGFTREVLASLVRDGLATTRTEITRGGGREVEAVRMRITDAGRRAIED